MKLKIQGTGREMVKTKKDVVIAVDAILAGFVLVFALVFLGEFPDTVRTFVAGFVIGFVIGSAFLWPVHRALALRATVGPDKSSFLGLTSQGERREMRTIITFFALALLVFVILMYTFNQLPTEKFDKIAPIVSGLVTAILAYYFRPTKKLVSTEGNVQEENLSLRSRRHQSASTPSEHRPEEEALRRLEQNRTAAQAGLHRGSLSTTIDTNSRIRTI